MKVTAYLIGAGSMTLGVEKALKCMISELFETPEYAKNAQTWSLNRPDTPVNVLNLDHRDRTLSSLEQRDLIFGNPPCGGVSAMTCSRLDSPTNNCMRRWIRMVAPARPRYILMENGYQLDTKRMAPLLEDLGSVLDEHGYNWWTWKFYSWQVGTPQVRRRMFLCATLHDVARPDLLELDDLPKKPNITCWPWLEDLAQVEPTPDSAIQHWWDEKDNAFKTREWLSKNIHRVKHGYVSLSDVRWARNRYEREPTEENKKNLIEREKKCDHALSREFDCISMFRPCHLSVDKVAPAMIGAYKFVHPTLPRFLTMREMARLMGYPDTWQFHVLKPHLIAQGIPVENAAWATDRMLRVTGERK